MSAIKEFVALLVAERDFQIDAAVQGDNAAMRQVRRLWNARQSLPPDHPERCAAEAIDPAHPPLSFGFDRQGWPVAYRQLAGTYLPTCRVPRGQRGGCQPGRYARI